MESLEYIVHFIRVGILIGFFPYSLLLFLFKRSKRFTQLFLAEFDNLACRIVIYSGICISIVCLATLLTAPSGEFFEFYILAAATQVSIWLLTTQLLRVRYLRGKLWYRALLSLGAFLTLERVVIILTSLNRDYLPSSWFLYFGPLDFLNMCLLSGLSMIAVTAIVYFVRKGVIRINGLKNRT